METRDRVDNKGSKESQRLPFEALNENAPDGLVVDRLATDFPEMATWELDRLVESVKLHRIKQSIQVLRQGSRVIEGRCRLWAWRIAFPGIPFPADKIEWIEDGMGPWEAMATVDDYNLNRRMMNVIQRAAFGAIRYSQVKVLIEDNSGKRTDLKGNLLCPGITGCEEESEDEDSPSSRMVEGFGHEIPKHFKGMTALKIAAVMSGASESAISQANEIRIESPEVFKHVFEGVVGVKPAYRVVKWTPARLLTIIVGQGLASIEAHADLLRKGEKRRLALKENEAWQLDLEARIKASPDVAPMSEVDQDWFGWVVTSGPFQGMSIELGPEVACRVDGEVFKAPHLYHNLAAITGEGPPIDDVLAKKRRMEEEARKEAEKSKQVAEAAKAPTEGDERPPLPTTYKELTAQAARLGLTPEDLHLLDPRRVIAPVLKWCLSGGEARFDEAITYLTGEARERVRELRRLAKTQQLWDWLVGYLYKAGWVGTMDPGKKIVLSLKHLEIPDAGDATFLAPDPSAMLGLKGGSVRWRNKHLALGPMLPLIPLIFGEVPPPAPKTKEGPAAGPASPWSKGQRVKALEDSGIDLRRGMRGTITAALSSGLLEVDFDEMEGGITRKPHQVEHVPSLPFVSDEEAAAHAADLAAKRKAEEDASIAKFRSAVQGGEITDGRHPAPSDQQQDDQEDEAGDQEEEAEEANEDQLDFEAFASWRVGVWVEVIKEIPAPSDSSADTRHHPIKRGRQGIITFANYGYLVVEFHPGVSRLTQKAALKMLKIVERPRLKPGMRVRALRRCGENIPEGAEGMVDWVVADKDRAKVYFYDGGPHTVSFARSSFEVLLPPPPETEVEPGDIVRLIAPVGTRGDHWTVVSLKVVDGACVAQIEVVGSGVTADSAVCLLEKVEVAVEAEKPAAETPTDPWIQPGHMVRIAGEVKAVEVKRLVEKADELWIEVADPTIQFQFVCYPRHRVTLCDEQPCASPLGEMAMSAAMLVITEQARLLAQHDDWRRAEGHADPCPWGDALAALLRAAEALEERR